MAEAAPLLALGRLLAPGSRTLARRVTQAVQEPKTFLAANPALADSWGLTRPHPRLGWIALAEALLAAKACRRIDGKTDAANLAAAIAQISGAPRGTAAGMKSDPALAERSTGELLELAGAALRKRGRELAALELDSDSYFLVLVPLADVAALSRLAGARLRRFGDRLAAATRERIRDVRREQRREQREARQEVARQRAGERNRRGATQELVRGAGPTCEQRSITVPPHAPNQCLLTSLSSSGMRRECHSFWQGRVETRAQVSRRPDPAAAQAFAAEQAASARRQGFRAAPVGAALWGSPAAAVFPDDGRYFHEGPLVVRWVALRGCAVWTASGNPAAGSFAQEPLVEHYPTATESEAAFDAELRLRAECKHRPLTRRACLARFGR